MLEKKEYLKSDLSSDRKKLEEEHMKYKLRRRKKLEQGGTGREELQRYMRKLLRY